MKTIYFLAASLLLFIGLNSCNKETLRGNGSILNESRTLSSFQHIVVSGDRNVEIVKGNAWKIEVTGYQNLVRVFRTYVTNGQLYFDYPDYCAIRNDNIRVKVFTPFINGLTMSGSTDVSIADGFTAAKFEANLSGSGRLIINGGQFQQMNIYTSGSAHVYALPAIAQKADIVISGSAQIELQPIDFLKVRISGSGKVHYWGDPQLDVQISGSGKVIKH